MMDLALAGWMSGLVEWGKVRHVLGGGRRWQPGRRFRLLFAGYNGARNTGSDVRVEEMLRQVRHVLGPDRVELSVLTQDPERTRGYFGDARQIRLPDIFPPFLSREVPRHDGVITCEGSMFKSKFADALTVMMVGALGVAAAHNRLAVGYGAEAGKMNLGPLWMTSRYARDALVVARSEESRDLLSGLGVPVELGTDTAWTFEPKPDAFGRAKLREAGWDGRAPVLAVCPINPFWWPVRASLLKGLGRLVGGFRASHYRSIYFHRASRAVDRAYTAYLDGLATAVRTFRERHDVFPVLVAMERLDARPCAGIAERIDGGLPTFTSDTFDMYELVSIARQASWMISSRYHGLVTTMPAGVLSCGVTMDERIRNLMRQRGQPSLVAEVDDPDLADRALAMLEELRTDGERVGAGIRRTVVDHLRAMARMGVVLESRVRDLYPDFETRTGVHGWRDYLPPLSPRLEELVALVAAQESPEAAEADA